MKKWLFISSLMVVSPIFSMSRARVLRRGASLARNSIRRSSTSVSKNSPKPKLTPLRVGVGLSASLIAVWGTRVAIDEYIFYSAEQLLASLENHSPSSVAFITAISKSSSEVIQKLLEEDTNGTLVNAPDPFGNSPLTVACVRGNTEVVQVLLDNGADVVADSTPLIVALLKNDITIVKMLLKKGANVEKIRYKDFGKLQRYWSLTPSLAWPYKKWRRRDKVSDMLYGTIRGYSHGDSLFTRVNSFLLGRVSGRTVYGRGEKAHYTPLTVAVAWASPDIIQLLIDNGASVKADPVLLKVAVGRNPEILNILLNNGADVKTDPSLLVLAARESPHRESVEIARILLEHGANPNVQDKNGKTPLMLASRCRDWTVGRNGSVSSFPTFGEKSFLSMVDLLAEYGADVNTRDKDGMTPLMWASRRGHVTMVDALVAHGADLEATDKNRLTSLNWALREGRIKIAEMLVAYDVDLPGTSVNELT